MAFPIDYQWCLCGKILKDGSGEIDISNGTLTYTLSGRVLTIQSEIDKNVNYELCVSAIDAKGNELFTCIQLNKPGVDVQCHKCDPSNKRVQINYLAIASEVETWRPILLEAAKQ